ncbi:DGQHR domain-containing protein [Pontibacter cellulosilyticus]
MKVKDVVNEDTGVKSVPESKKIYTSKNLNEILQRLEDPKRIEPLKKYLLMQKDRYFNSLTVAITDGDPQWHPIAIQQDEKFSEDNIEYLNLKYGILELTGKEDLFILDGQHRLLGLREAMKDSPKIGEEEVSVMLVIHEDTNEGKKKLRRIFVALNRNSKPVSEGENIVLEEDDVSAIIARQLVESYKPFQKNSVIAFNKNLNLKQGAKDLHKFTSLLALYNINEVIFDNERFYDKKIQGKFVRIRPSDELIKAAYKDAEDFWNMYFDTFPKAKAFINKPLDYEGYKLDDGGLFYLRPIGQELVALYYEYLRLENNLKFFKPSLKKVEERLDSDFWKYILFNPHTGKILMNKGIALSYLQYNLGLAIPANKLSVLRSNYKKNSGELELNLPKPKYI